MKTVNCKSCGAQIVFGVNVETMKLVPLDIQGEGPCNWWQGERFPCRTDDLDMGFYEEASQEFLNAVYAENRERREDAASELYISGQGVE